MNFTIQFILQIKIVDQVYLFSQGGRLNDTPVMVDYIFQLFFLKRHEDSFRLELDDLLDAIENSCQPMVTRADGLAALLLANAAHESAETGRAIRLMESDT